MEELVSAVEGSEESIHICGVEAGKSTWVVRICVSSFDVVGRKNFRSNDTAIDNDNDNDNGKDESTTSHAQCHGLEDLDAGLRQNLPRSVLS